ncbi:TPA: hypothetical protein L4S64_005771 [Pseudomonas aeruginosa]|uniref:hypothetical protein n=1 Tax=Pseudomonas aeruginosa TaxID=287 RepID=UPI00071E4DDD|nr:hypothetical protein [Pseudomonas aeruginosa]KSE80037.1 hypothetical protein AO924_23800 [Pseudomonas aeruginosa]RUC64456.1 hypothetical protein IPC1389_15715 [Pseudomonas aeruginosa]HBO3014739.1 hypothetical protein [Pseudomonas aeruginosa]HBO3618009.1 hypothetical protein [Pseudomonas aeruginosa]HCF4732559.1 hypothetical protein [Pseudomonas aeruginosa]
MNPLFTNLTQETLAYLEDQLSNNDVAGDDELIDLFIEELSLTLEQAEAAVALRDQYLSQVFLNGQGPLHQDDGLSFDPHTKSVR